MEKEKINKISKVLLIVLDGFGLAPEGAGNPISAKEMPFLDSLIRGYKSSTLLASGLVVGLEWGTYGNSEVGHGAMGTGRVVVQALARINSEIRNKKFFKNDAFKKVLNHAEKNKSQIHLVGCLSPGGIHSHEGHLSALLDFFIENKFSSVCVHVITDGEDSAKDQGLKSLEKIQKSLHESGAKIATISGRNYAMDRVKNWHLTKKAWDVMVHGKGDKFKRGEEYVANSYANNVFDADIIPSTSDDEITIKDGDGIIFFNFRNDRMKQLVAPFVEKDFKGFERGIFPKNLSVATMTDYDDSFDVLIAYPPEVLVNTLGEVISKEGYKQIRIAEGEKEAHVTNFFNGGKLDAYKGEERDIAVSRALTGDEYLKHPEMSAGAIAENVLKSLKKEYILTVVNFANTDMIAHTGNIPAVLKALEIIDKLLKKIIEAVDLSTTAVIITADHGNAEELIDPATNASDTQHSTANVPIIFINDKFKEESGKTLDNLFAEKPIGSLIDIAPSVLGILDIKQPDEMSGSKLII
ncbi:2,3-bisphosphoglycerate-independent phosphoglycerate mutase [Patescibacteria group bacterium]|nr:2,3-bisphosphoglycerate-independent phosphoglycerate mutase [Patescibacteria group bacterium]